MFSSNALEKESNIRFSSRQYKKLAKKIGTKNILIHLPSSLSEWKNFEFGFQVIVDELMRDEDIIIHFEIIRNMLTLKPSVFK